MKYLISILFITFVSCSNFIQRENRIREINLKNENMIITNFVDQLFEKLSKLFDKALNNLLYLFDNANTETILKELKEVHINSDNFLKEHNLNKMIEVENKVNVQINEGIKFEIHAIDKYLRLNKFPESFIKYINDWIKQKKQPLKFNPFSSFKNQMEFDEKELYKNISQKLKNINELETEFKKSYDNIVMIIAIYQMFLDKSISEITQNLKSVFPKIKAIFSNEKQFNDLKKKIRTFFIIKNIATIEDFDLLNKGYDLIFSKILATYKLDLFEGICSMMIKILNDYNIFIHENHKGIPAYSIIVEGIIKIFKQYNFHQFISDIKSVLKNFSAKIVSILTQKKINFEKILPQLKEKINSMK